MLTWIARTLRRAAALAVTCLALPAASAAQEDIRLVTLRSPAFQGERKLIVRIPPAYAQQPGRRFPVLYYTDGPAHADSLAATVRFLEGQGRIPPLVLVGVVHEDRSRELTPTRERGYPTSGGADVLLAFLEKEVVPWIDATYRTAPLRILAGHSLGGLFSIHVLTVRPGLFRAHVALSPSLRWDSELVLRRLTELVAKQPDLRATVVVAQGDEGPELARAIEKLRGILAAAPGVTFHAHTFPGEDHGSVVFPAHHRALQDVFAGWKMPVADDDVGPRGGLAAVDAHYRALSERLGWVVEPPEATANLAAYQLLREGDPVSALAAFQQVVERHPDSANAHDSLGEALERSNDLEGARREYGIAVEVGTRGKEPGLPQYQQHLARVRSALQARGAGGLGR